MNAQTNDFINSGPSGPLETRILVKGCTIDAPGTWCYESALQYEPQVVQGKKAHILRLHIADPSSRLLNLDKDDARIWIGGEAKKKVFFERVNDILLDDGSGRYFSRKTTREMNLEAHELRETLTIEVWFSDEITLLHGPMITHTRFANDLRLSFDDIGDQLALSSGYYPKMIKGLVDFAGKIHQSQIARGVTANGALAGFYEQYHEGLSRDAYHELASSVVQEVSVLFNTVLARYCRKRKVPILYRNVGKRIKREVKKETRIVKPWTNGLQERFLQLFRPLDRVVIKTVEIEEYEQTKDVDMFYSTVAVCHAGLRIPEYATFGAPLRCPVSLMNLLQISAVALDKHPPFTNADLGMFSNRINAS